MSKKEFFTEFLKQGNTIGSITPSSKFLVKKMVDPIDFSKAKCIVEFGPGTGTITQEILNRMPKDGLLLVFEINNEFCERLRKEISDPRMRVITDSAENIEKYLLENNIKHVDYVVSSLPFSVIPNKVVKNILTAVKKVLNPTGAFIQYQYSLNVYRKLKNTFRKVSLNFAAINFPPAFIYICTL